MKDFVRLLETMERDLARIDWQDVAIAVCFIALVGLGVIGIVVGWW